MNMQEKLRKYIIFKFFSITNGFTDVIGQGGYATVFKGTTNRRKLELAIKKLKVGATDEDRDAMERQLNYEVDQFERYKRNFFCLLLFYSLDKLKPKTKNQNNFFLCK